MEHVRDLMVRAVATCRPNESLDAAVGRMREYDCGMLPVVDDGDRILGVVTDRDVALAAADYGQALGRIAVNLAMSTNVDTVSELGDVTDAHEAMRSKGVRRVPVVDDGERLVGVLSLDDLAAGATGDDSVGGLRMSRMVAETLAAVHQRHAARVVREGGWTRSGHEDRDFADIVAAE